MKKTLLLFAVLILAMLMAGCGNRWDNGIIEYDYPIRSNSRSDARSSARPDTRSSTRSSGPRSSSWSPYRAPTLGRSYDTPGNSNLLAYYQTEFDTAEANRATNIELAAAAINEKIVNRGETFSFNDTIGSTTGERGYKKSVIFVDGTISEGYGGGVCQVSTTLCNAAANAGMTIIERHDHSLPVTYMSNGLQAATSHNGGLDFKFKNEMHHDVVIIAKAENGKVSVRVEKV